MVTLAPGPREQLNQNTAFVDASHIYGNDRCDASDLREGIDGRLNTSLPHSSRGKHLVMVFLRETQICVVRHENRLYDTN
jgi:hypothetical protein